MLNKRFILLVAILSMFILALAGCSNNVEDNIEKYKEIKVGDNQTGRGGDTFNSVQKKLGKADNTNGENHGSISMETHTYYDVLGEGTTVKIVYLDGGVAAKNTNATID